MAKLAAQLIQQVATGKIKNYRVDSSGIEIELKGVSNRNKYYSCANTAKHYSAVVTTAVMAFSADHSLSIAYNPALQSQSSNAPQKRVIAKLGIGQSPF